MTTANRRRGGASALLGALGMHGGTTATLLPSSLGLAINHGSNPDALSTDQRGDTRILPVIGGVIDIGAVKVA